MCPFIDGGPPSFDGPPKSKMLEKPVFKDAALHFCNLLRLTPTLI
jgi:hypothetical protein